ncbi:GNAT family N-acetyltransferase [Saccharibacillus sp. CPCC 101409]|uniref:GNAT family N-acetyltransferase n=1 Tax=Saccharibacillus sp. CPCC 101409 TaxID=3058041 RepID=UPI002673C5F7|nr:GNAT family N-acetyltransferase [Saccharibacillus sp. CPCC 101409]MDO3413391.1 GNAT family N-acetyltransferase [Saccharibacillus sp. CPCC 101409]
MEIRRITEQEFESSLELSQYAFLYKIGEREKELRRLNFADEPVWGVFEENELCAQLMLLPFEVYIHGRRIEMGGIASVSTWPEKRRQGMVSELLRRALEEMKDHGQLLSYLHPFSVSFYRKYGWELFTDYRKYSIPVDKLPSRQEVPGRVVRGIRDIDVMKTVYDQAITKYNGPLTRSGTWWEQRVLGPAPYTAVYYSASNEPQGYVLYAIEDGRWITREMFWLNEEARQGLWTFIGNHDSRIKEVRWNAPADDPLSLLLDDPLVKQEAEPYFMARIVDAAAFVSSYPFVATGEEKQAWTLRIEDRDAPWNAGFWNLTVQPGGQASLESLPLPSGGDEELVADICIDIGILTSMLLGYRRPVLLQAYGLIETSPQIAAVLERLIPYGTCFLADHF